MRAGLDGYILSAESGVRRSRTYNSPLRTFGVQADLLTSCRAPRLFIRSGYPESLWQIRIYRHSDLWHNRIGCLFVHMSHD